MPRRPPGPCSPSGTTGRARGQGFRAGRRFSIAGRMPVPGGTLQRATGERSCPASHCASRAKPPGILERLPLREPDSRPRVRPKRDAVAASPSRRLNSGLARPTTSRMVGRPMRAERFYPVVVVALSLTVLASHVLGATVAKGVLWGAHFYGFFPPGVLAAALLAALGAAFVVDLRLRKTTPRPARGSVPRSIITVALGAVAVALFWAWRIRHTLLGDSGPLSANLPLGQRSHPRQPLSLALHHQVYEWTRRLFEAPGRSPQDVAFDTVALGSAVAGGLFVWVAIALARELAAPPASSPPGGTNGGRVAILAAALLLTQGYMELFFGYVENYTWFTLAFALFLWSGLAYLRG